MSSTRVLLISMRMQIDPIEMNDPSKYQQQVNLAYNKRCADEIQPYDECNQTYNMIHFLNHCVNIIVIAFI